MNESQEAARNEIVSDKGDNMNNEEGPLTGAFLRYRESLRRYIARLVIRPEDVDDILQDTFVNIQSIKDAADIKSAKFYLYAVARHTAFRELKRQAARVADSIDEAIETGAEPAAAIAPLDEAFESRKHFETLTDVVSDLPPQCRRVFVLRKVFGYSHKEISATMGISISTVEKYLARAMMRCLQDHRLRGYRTDDDDVESSVSPTRLPSNAKHE